MKAQLLAEGRIPFARSLRRFSGQLAGTNFSTSSSIDWGLGLRDDSWSQIESRKTTGKRAGRRRAI
eukprot:6226388-Amphidinium_carterae.3